MPRMTTRSKPHDRIPSQQRRSIFNLAAANPFQMVVSVLLTLTVLTLISVFAVDLFRIHRSELYWRIVLATILDCPRREIYRLTVTDDLIALSDISPALRLHIEDGIAEINRRTAVVAPSWVLRHVGWNLIFWSRIETDPVELERREAERRAAGAPSTRI